ncbi:MAG: phage tail protein [Burkholderiales bacterium]|nr:phage tail protein [Burkholderiales bacterium]
MPDHAPERPVTNAHFLVDLGDRADPRAAQAGFMEVVFPVFHADDSGATPGQQHLTLKRGATGALNLYAWWDQARRGKAPKRRTLKVTLLADDQQTAVMRWQFSNARPLSLAYSPLNAMEGAVLIETLTLAFDRVELVNPARIGAR